MNSAADFIEALRQHRLLDPARLEELRQALQARVPEPRPLAAELIRRGWLTPFQVNQLFQGRGHELLLGNYVLLERLGEGGMGQVFKARHWKLDKIVALKLVRKERLTSTDAVRRFQREIQAAAVLDHPHIVRALDADQANNAHFFVMEHVEGMDLAQLVKRRGALPISEACDYVRQAAVGLQHAVERGLVHRDIKPHNLLLTGQGTVKILDMGLARLNQTRDDDDTHSTMTKEGVVMGTLDYLAPEQAMDAHEVDTRADLYSLGCTLFFLLTATVPFPGGNTMQKLARHRWDEPPSLLGLRPDAPAALAAIVRRLLAKRPEERFQAPAELADALTELHDAHAGTNAAADTEVITGLPDRLRAPTDTPHSDLPGAMTLLGESLRVGREVDEAVGQRFRLIVGGVVGVLLLVGVLVVVALQAPGGSTPPTEEVRPPLRQRPLVADRREDFEAWRKRVADLSAEEQGKAVAAKFKELNPGFDGNVKVYLLNQQVVRLELLTDHVTDLRPLQPLTKLTYLGCRGSAPGKGRLEDLTALRDLRLDALDCENNPLADLTPLKDMPLTMLASSYTEVADLRPLKGLPLHTLRLTATRVADLTPLRGLPLRALSCSDSGVADLRPLQGAALEVLECRQTRVADLTPLRGMPLIHLNCGHTLVADLAPLRGMPLTHLNCQAARVVDLTPLQGLPLKECFADISCWRDDEKVLRALPALESINFHAAADFWKKFADDRAAFDAWCRRVTTLPADEQLREVAAELRKRNPDFDGQLQPTVDQKGVVTRLHFRTDQVTDLAPVRALPGLERLTVQASPAAKRRLADLWPLKGMPLVALVATGNQIADLTPLRGMPLKLLFLDSNYSVTDLTPLTGMKLTQLALQRNPITDLTPLQGMPLTLLGCDETKVQDLSPLRDSKLTSFTCVHTPVKDLTPLQGLPLEVLNCDFRPERDAAILRAIATLKTLNGRPKAEVLKRGLTP